MTVSPRLVSAAAVKFKRLNLVFALAALAVLLTGCIWMRLLSLKNQFADFDRNFKVDDRHGLAIQCLNPVLYDTDVRYLAEVDPTATATNVGQQTWFWTFQKLRAPTNSETGDYDLAFTTSFANQKLIGVALPERFLIIMPEDFILGMLRAFGHATVDQKQRRATAKWEGGDDAKGPKLPTLADVSRLLGEAFSVKESATSCVCRYRYRMKSPSLTGTNQLPLMQAEFTFAKAPETLKRIDFTYSHSRMTLTFDNPPAKPGR